MEFEFSLLAHMQSTTTLLKQLLNQHDIPAIEFFAALFCGLSTESCVQPCDDINSEYNNININPKQNDLGELMVKLATFFCQSFTSTYLNLKRIRDLWSKCCKVPL